MSSPLQDARHALSLNSPRSLAEQALARANSNPGRNVYLALRPEHVLAQADALAQHLPKNQPPLYGIPIAIKDCFDMVGFPTTCGSRFYAEKNGIAREDSAIVARLRACGAVLTGKTHLHQLAYGITGENPEYGDSLQPARPESLTGGSSSGSAASVQEGSAIAAIGTDTGGSIRVPAALCGLAGYRASLGIGSWQGAAHLAPSFDTLGWLFRDLSDGLALAHALFDIPFATPPAHPRIFAVEGDFLHDCEPAVLATHRAWQHALQRYGATVLPYQPDFWQDSQEIFAGIQAHEAAAIHQGYFQHFEPVIADRLRWGASLSPETVVALRERHRIFRDRMDALLHQRPDPPLTQTLTHTPADPLATTPQSSGRFLLLPCAPTAALPAKADHLEARRIILRYTTPVSLAGFPAVTLPGAAGGVQLVAPRGQDAQLLALAAALGALAP